MSHPLPLKGIRVALAGKFSVRWAQIQEAIEFAGGEYVEYVHSATGILVVGEGTMEDGIKSFSHTAKIGYAKTHGVKIMTEEEFAELILPAFEYDPKRATIEAQAKLNKNEHYGDW